MDRNPCKDMSPAGDRIPVTRPIRMIQSCFSYREYPTQLFRYTRDGPGTRNDRRLFPTPQCLSRPLGNVLGWKGGESRAIARTDVEADQQRQVISDRSADRISAATSRRKCGGCNGRWSVFASGNPAVSQALRPRPVTLRPWLAPGLPCFRIQYGKSK